MGNQFSAICDAHDLQFCALDGSAKAFFVKRLEQIVQDIGLKCLYRVTVVCGGEDDRWKHGSGHALQDSKSVDSRHLNVQKQNVWSVGLQTTDGLRTVRALGENLHTLRLRHPSDGSPCYLLVLRNDRPHIHLPISTPDARPDEGNGSSGLGHDSVSKGIRTSTSN